MRGTTASDRATAGSLPLPKERTVEDPVTSQRRANPAFNAGVTAPRWRLRDRMPAGSRGIAAVSTFGDGDGSFWDRWLGAPPPAVSSFRTGVVTTDRVKPGASTGALASARRQIAGAGKDDDDDVAPNSHSGRVVSRLKTEHKKASKTFAALAAEMDDLKASYRAAQAAEEAGEAAPVAAADALGGEAIAAGSAEGAADVAPDAPEEEEGTPKTPLEVWRKQHFDRFKDAMGEKEDAGARLKRLEARMTKAGVRCGSGDGIGNGDASAAAPATASDGAVLDILAMQQQHALEMRAERRRRLSKARKRGPPSLERRSEMQREAALDPTRAKYYGYGARRNFFSAAKNVLSPQFSAMKGDFPYQAAPDSIDLASPTFARVRSSRSRRIGEKPKTAEREGLGSAPATPSRPLARDAIDELIGAADGDESDVGEESATFVLSGATGVVGSDIRAVAADDGARPHSVPTLATFASNFAGFKIGDEAALSESFAEFDSAAAEYAERPSSFRREYVARCARLGVVPEPVAIRSIEAAYSAADLRSAANAVAAFQGSFASSSQKEQDLELVGGVGGWGSGVVNHDVSEGRYARSTGRIGRAKSTYQQDGSVSVALALVKHATDPANKASFTAGGPATLDPEVVLKKRSLEAEARFGSLNFAHFSLGPKAAPLIESIACSWLPDVEMLNLRNNRLSPATASRLLDVVRLGLPDLTSLDVSQNLGVGIGCANGVLDAALDVLDAAGDEAQTHFAPLLAAHLAELAGEDEATDREEALSQRMALFDAVVAASAPPPAAAPDVEDGDGPGAQDLFELVGANLSEVGITKKSKHHTRYVAQLRAYGVVAVAEGEGKEAPPLALPLPFVSASSLCDMLRHHRKLQCLRLSECGVTALHLEAIAAALCSHRAGKGFGAPSLPLRVLDLSHNAATLCTIPSARADADDEMVAGDMGSVVAAAALIAFFHSRSNLAELNLEHNNIGGFVARAVARAVSRAHCRLHILRLAHNSFGRSGERELEIDEEGDVVGRTRGGVGGEEASDGAWGVAQGEPVPADVGTPAEQLGIALSYNKSLELVDLSFNGIRAVPCVVIAASVWAHPNLRGLHMSGNPIGEHGAAALLRTASTRVESVKMRFQRCSDFMRLYGGVEEEITDDESLSSSSSSSEEEDDDEPEPAADAGVSRPSSGLAVMLEEVGVGKFVFEAVDAEELIGLEAELAALNTILRPPFLGMISQWSGMNIQGDECGDSLVAKDEVIEYVQATYPTIAAECVVEHAYVQAALFESEDAIRAQSASVAEHTDALDTLVTSREGDEKGGYHRTALHRRASVELTGIWATEARDIDDGQDDELMDRGELRWMLREIRRICLMRMKYLGALDVPATPIDEWLDSANVQEKLRVLHGGDMGTLLAAPPPSRGSGGFGGFGGGGANHPLHSLLWVNLSLPGSGNMGKRRGGKGLKKALSSRLTEAAMLASRRESQLPAEAQHQRNAGGADDRYSAMLEYAEGDDATVVSNQELARTQREKMRALAAQKMHLKSEDSSPGRGLRLKEAPHLPEPPFELLLNNCDITYVSAAEPASELFEVNLAMAPGEFDEPEKESGYALDLSDGIQWAAAVALIRLARRYPLAFRATPPAGSDKIVAEAEAERLERINERLTLAAAKEAEVAAKEAATTFATRAAVAMADGGATAPAADADGGADASPDERADDEEGDDVASEGGAVSAAASSRAAINAAAKKELAGHQWVALIAPEDKRDPTVLVTHAELAGEKRAWFPPHSGTLKLAVKWQRLARASEDAIDDTQLLSIAYTLRHVLATRCERMLPLATVPCTFTAVQGRRLLNLVRPPHVAHVVGTMIDSIVDDPDLFRQTSLTALQNDLFTAFLGRSMQYVPLNPTGRYRLRTANHGDMVILNKLLEVSRLEGVIATQCDWPDTSQDGRRSGFRNAYVEKSRAKASAEPPPVEGGAAFVLAAETGAGAGASAGVGSAGRGGVWGLGLERVSVIIHAEEENDFMSDADVEFVNFDFVSIMRPQVRHALGQHNGRQNGHAIGPHGHHSGVHKHTFCCSIAELWRLLRRIGLRSGIDNPVRFFLNMSSNIEKEMAAGQREFHESGQLSPTSTAERYAAELKAQRLAAVEITPLKKMVALGRSVKDTLHALRRALAHGSMYLTSNQVRIIMRCFPMEVCAARIEVAVLCFHHVLDLADYADKIALDLGSRRDVVRVAQRLGWLNVINPHRPSHFYYFRLEHTDEWRALQLMAILGREPGENWVGEWYSAAPECLSANAAEEKKLFEEWRTKHGSGWATFKEVGDTVKVAEAKDAEPWSSRPIIEMLHKGCGWTLAKGGATAKKPVAWAVQQKYYDAPHVAFGRSGACFFYYQDPSEEEMAQMDEPISEEDCERFKEGSAHSSYTTHTGRREAMCAMGLVAVVKKMVPWPTDPRKEAMRRIALEEEAAREGTLSEAEKVMRNLARTQMRMTLLLSKPHELSAEWKQLDNNNNGTISIMEIDSWMSLRFPEIASTASRQVRLQAFTVTYRSKANESKSGIFRKDFAMYLRNLLSFMELQCIFASISTHVEDKFIDVDDFCAFCDHVGLFKNRDEMVVEFHHIADGSSGKLIFVDFCRWFCRVRAASAKAKAAAARQQVTR